MDAYVCDELDDVEDFEQNIDFSPDITEDPD